MPCKSIAVCESGLNQNGNYNQNIYQSHKKQKQRIKETTLEHKTKPTEQGDNPRTQNQSYGA